MDALSDRDLIVRARRGETAAFGELVRRTQTAVFNVCYRLLGERREAEDLAQEAFLRAFERLATFDMERPFLPWMRRVAANHCLNHLAARPPAPLALDEARDQADAGPTPAALAEQHEQTARLRQALCALPPHYRAVIELRHFQELSYADIAATLQRPVSDVKSDLFRARQLLAKKLTDAAPD